MSHSFTSAHDRDGRRRCRTSRSLTIGHGLLALSTMAGMLAIALASLGRAHSGAAGEGVRLPDPVTLHAVQRSEQLEPALAAILPHEADRRFAAAALLERLRATRGVLPNVGDLARARVDTAAIDRASGLNEYRHRVDRAREAARQRGAPAPVDVPVLTATDLAAVKRGWTVRTQDEVTRLTTLWAAVCIGAFWMVAVVWRLAGIRGDLVLLGAVQTLVCVGFAALVARQDPLRDTVLFVRYAQAVTAGIALCGVLAAIDARRLSRVTPTVLPLGAALLLCVALLLFGDGPGSSQVKVNLGPAQPIEAIRLLLVLFLAGYFARRWELLRQVNSRLLGSSSGARGLPLPRVRYVLPVGTGVGMALALFFLQKDLGPALFLSMLFLAMYAIARSRVALAIAGIAALVAGFAIGHALELSSTLVARIEMWRSPWDNAVRGGDQVAHAFWALSTGGLGGTGLGLGDTRYLPAGHTDLVLAAIGEELGLAGLAAVGAIYAVIAARGLRTAQRAATDYGFFLACGLTLFLVLPIVIMAAGMLAVMPLTGVVTPFLSYGGSAMVANFAALGLLIAIGVPAGSAPAGDTAPFRTPLRWVRASLGAAAVALCAVLIHVQAIAADATVVRAHLGLQADGARRQQHNQRMLDAAARLPRGTIFDRRGFPLATGEAARAAGAREQSRASGLAPPASCAAPIDRCYPLGGAAFHLLGDARTRLNWSASNSSYAEREYDARLRGFDTHAALVPLLRHRYEPDHPEVRAILDRPRDVMLTVDARLQATLARLLTAHGAKSPRGRAAAAVLDPDTGDILALASVPFPDGGEEDGRAGDVTQADALLDRARFGLYPPGSTFKLITAAAALRQDDRVRDEAFVCSLLPGGRIGGRIPRWGVVRDDVLDKHPHGMVRLRDGLVRSCNAYFAALAVRLGPDPLIDVAERLGLSLAPRNSRDRVRATLAHAGYGQGDVLATPLRMARAVGAIASGGLVREPRLEHSAERTAPRRLLSPEDARLLADALRDAVVSGTGRSLRQHPGRIAGKTGTAEVAGAPSHAWFVGFAPAGNAPRRIAFAVLVENAGYGARAAAPLAGELVSAALDLGVIH